MVQICILALFAQAFWHAAFVLVFSAVTYEHKKKGGLSYSINNKYWFILSFGTVLDFEITQFVKIRKHELDLLITEDLIMKVKND
ncbi:hypothetical protein BpHYR1_037596 [Brachionus plicatilis]|uniref:Uncharacterized protein n=1 Tax=Brachionus plicatilis TaxID=10195 RepID=A0A3M7SBW1_BRAPC|nr:hypothetical protein BpHYR1_037596 [Brachionus plicatilis]